MKLSTVGWDCLFDKGGLRPPLNPPNLLRKPPPPLKLLDRKIHETNIIYYTAFHQKMRFSALYTNIIIYTLYCWMGLLVRQGGATPPLEPPKFVKNTTTTIETTRSKIHETNIIYYTAFLWKCVFLHNMYSLLLNGTACSTSTPPLGPPPPPQ